LITDDLASEREFTISWLHVNPFRFEAHRIGDGFVNKFVLQKSSRTASQLRESDSEIFCIFGDI
jgi:hypothetical protein